MPESRSFQPTAWRAKTASHVFKPVMPRLDHGMHVNLHRNLNPRYQRPDTFVDPINYHATLSTIYRQRPTQRVFSCQAPVKSYPVQTVTRRLSMFDPVCGPPGSTVNPDGKARTFPYIVCNKPFYSAREVKGIVDRLYSRKEAEGRCPMKLQWQSNRKNYPAEVLEEVIQLYCSTEKLCENPPHRNITRHRNLILEDINASQRKYSSADINQSVRRLSEYNPKKWPPNSKGVMPDEHELPVKVKYPAGPAPSQAYVDNLVDRLYNGQIDKDAYSQVKHKQENQRKVRPKTAFPARERNDYKYETASDDFEQSDGEINEEENSAPENKEQNKIDESRNDEKENPTVEQKETENNPSQQNKENKEPKYQHKIEDLSQKHEDQPADMQKSQEKSKSENKTVEENPESPAESVKDEVDDSDNKHELNKMNGKSAENSTVEQGNTMENSMENPQEPEEADM